MAIVDQGHYQAVPVVPREKSIRIGDGAEFRQTYLLGQADRSLPMDHLIVGQDARVDLCFILLPGAADVDLPLKVDITGSGADVRLAGILLCGGDDRVRLATEVHHRMPGSTSDQLFASLVGGHAHRRFTGKIIVAPDAQQTEAYQTDRNVVISSEGQAETKPQLEIYADDVKCSHGATVGNLNAEEQFYMQSRGIPEAEAKILQMISFVSPVLDHVDPARREALAQVVEDAIRTLL